MRWLSYFCHIEDTISCLQVCGTLRSNSSVLLSMQTTANRGGSFHGNTLMCNDNKIFSIYKRKYMVRLNYICTYTECGCLQLLNFLLLHECIFVICLRAYVGLYCHDIYCDNIKSHPRVFIQGMQLECCLPLNKVLLTRNVHLCILCSQMFVYANVHVIVSVRINTWTDKNLDVEFSTSYKTELTYSLCM